MPRQRAPIAISRFAARVPRFPEFALLKQIPNALTLTRLVLAPVIAWLVWLSFDALANPPQTVSPQQLIADLRAAAAILFVIAALTDLFDGMIARRFDAHSKFGRIIDPIADKALVGLPLIAIALVSWRYEYFSWQVVVIATAIIVLRDVTMTVVRLISPDGEGVRVSSLAKWKTALELVVVGLFLALIALQSQFDLLGSAGANNPLQMGIMMVGFLWPLLLAIAALLSAWTGYQYLAPKR